MQTQRNSKYTANLLTKPRVSDLKTKLSLTLTQTVWNKNQLFQVS